MSASGLDADALTAAHEVPPYGPIAQPIFTRVVTATGHDGCPVERLLLDPPLPSPWGTDAKRGGDDSLHDPDGVAC